MKVSVADAKNKLPELIKAVEGGESITICRRGSSARGVIAFPRRVSTATKLRCHHTSKCFSSNN